MIDYPWVAALPGILFVALGTVCKSRIASTSGLVWLAYGAYEYGMKTRVLCSGECNIRVDLLLIYPLLAVLTVAAAIGLARAAIRQYR